MESFISFIVALTMMAVGICLLALALSNFAPLYAVFGVFVLIVIIVKLRNS